MRATQLDRLSAYMVEMLASSYTASKYRATLSLIVFMAMSNLSSTFTLL